MSMPDPEQENRLRIQRLVAFASALFQGDVASRRLLESLLEGVVIVEGSGTILLANPRAEQLFGYPRGELAGSPLAALIPERFRKVHEEHMARFFLEPKLAPQDRRA